MAAKRLLDLLTNRRSGSTTAQMNQQFDSEIGQSDLFERASTPVHLSRQKGTQLPVGRTLMALLMATTLTQVSCLAGATSSDIQGASAMRKDMMTVHLKINGKTLVATMRDNATARDFISLLPLTLTLEDYARTEKISDLPRKLTKEGAPSGSDPSIGDITYYAPWGNMAIFYKDAVYASGLIILGKIEGGIEALTASGGGKVTIVQVDP